MREIGYNQHMLTLQNLNELIVISGGPGSYYAGDPGALFSRAQYRAWGERHALQDGCYPQEGYAVFATRYGDGFFTSEDALWGLICQTGALALVDLQVLPATAAQLQWCAAYGLLWRVQRGIILYHHPTAGTFDFQIHGLMHEGLCQDLQISFDTSCFVPLADSLS